MLLRTILLPAIALGQHILRASDVHAPFHSLTLPHLIQRQSDISGSEAASASYVPLNPDGTLNQTAWSAKVHAACVSTLRMISRSSNPSGNCVCYNLASLDTDEGVFAADLRLYRLSEPRDEFSGVENGELKVAVAFNGATVTSEIESEGDASGNGNGNGNDNAKRQEQAGPNEEADPELLKVNMLMGRIDEDKMAPDMSMADFEALLMPLLTLFLPGTSISTTVTSNEAAFLVGVFAMAEVTSDFSAARAAVDAQMAALDAGETVFVMPGVQIMVFPVGLVITGTWLLVGLAVVGWGTWERYKYADMFRRRVASSEIRLARTL